MELCKTKAGSVEKVILSGAQEVGGLSGFVDGLRDGFEAHCIEVQVVSSPWAMLALIKDLRNPKILKIFSTWGGFFSAISVNYCVVAHGFPRVDAQGWLKTHLILASYLPASMSGHLVTVSHYAASHLKACYGIHANTIIHNPLSNIFLAERKAGPRTCDFLYVGRLDKVKRVRQFLMILAQMRKETPSLRVRIAGDGPERAGLQEEFEPLGFDFLGSQEPGMVLAELDQAQVFFSGCETEALGIAYLEALARGCKVVMPAGGGGLEIFLEGIQKNIFLAPLDLEPVGTERALRDALAARPGPADLSGFRPRAIAQDYLHFLS